MRAEFRHTFLKDTTTVRTLNLPSASEKFEIPNGSTPFASICNKMHHSTREFLPAANFAELTHSLLDPRGGETVLTRIRGNTHFFFDMTAATWIKPLFKSDVARTGSTAID